MKVCLSAQQRENLKLVKQDSDLDSSRLSYLLHVYHPTSVKLVQAVEVAVLVELERAVQTVKTESLNRSKPSLSECVMMTERRREPLRKCERISVYTSHY